MVIAEVTIFFVTVDGLEESLGLTFTPVSQPTSLEAVGEH